MYHKALTIASLLVSFTVAQAAETTVTWSNNSTALFLNASGVALSGGTAGVQQDGSLIQLGYFSLGTTSNNFLGTWIPITLTTTIGDSSTGAGLANGRFNFITTFTAGTNSVAVYDAQAGFYTTTSSLTITTSAPPLNQVMAIRFYDSNSGAGNYNTVSADTWIWSTPVDGGATLNIPQITSSTTGLEWQDAANPFKTTIPEPSTALLMVLGAAGLIARRRR